MERRVVNMALSAIVIGVGVRLAETSIANVLAIQAPPIFPPDMSLLNFEWRELWHSAIFIWALPSALGAFLVACLKPQRGLVYGACAVLPGALVTIERSMALIQNEIPYTFLLFMDLVNLALLPSFLWLFYALIRRHSARSP